MRRGRAVACSAASLPPALEKPPKSRLCPGRGLPPGRLVFPRQRNGQVLVPGTSQIEQVGTFPRLRLVSCSANPCSSPWKVGGASSALSAAANLSRRLRGLWVGRSERSRWASSAFMASACSPTSSTFAPCGRSTFTWRASSFIAWRFLMVRCSSLSSLHLIRVGLLTLSSWAIFAKLSPWAVSSLNRTLVSRPFATLTLSFSCLLYTSDAADD